jgi:hypothetical protein
MSDSERYPPPPFPPPLNPKLSPLNSIVHHNSDDSRSDSRSDSSEVGAEDMESEARAEWLRRGFFEEDFTVQKMIKIWEDEDAKELVDNTNKGENNLEEKLALIQSRKEQQLSLKVVAETLKNSKENIKYAVKNAAISMKNALETPYQKRRRELREHVARISAMEKEAKRLEELKIATKEKRYEDRKAEQERVEERKARIDFEKPTSEILRYLVKKAEKDDRQRQIDEWDARRIAEFERVLPFLSPLFRTSRHYHMFPFHTPPPIWIPRWCIKQYS